VSDSAINKLRCEDDITNIVYPQDRQVDVRAEGSDAFVRFSGAGFFVPPPIPNAVNPETELPPVSIRRLPPMEIYIYCGPDAYSLALVPTVNPIPTIVKLESTGTFRKEIIRRHESSLPYELMITEIIKAAYTETPPSMYEVRFVNKPVADFVQGDLIKASEWVGDKHAIVTYLFTSTIQAPLEFIETQFLSLEPHPLAIAMSNQTVNPGETIRIFIVRSLAHEYK